MFLTQKYSRFSTYFYRGLDDHLRSVLVSDFDIRTEDIDTIFSPAQLSKYEIRKEYSYFALQLGEIIANTLEPRQIHCFVSPTYFLCIDE